METEEKTFIKLPEIDTIKISNESTYNNVYKKLLKKFVLESIGKYYSKNYIERKLEKIDRIVIDRDIHYVGNTVFKNNVLKLPRFFFTTEIIKTEDVINLMTSYPALKDLLTTYGIFIVGTNSKDKLEDKIIKNIIATYFATKSSNNSLDRIKVAEMTFNSYATSNALKENIIREIALIFGEDLLIKTLQEGTDSFIKEVDSLTKKKGLGKKIVDSLVQLYDLSMKEKEYFAIYSSLEKITSDKLIPMYTIIQKYAPVYQDSILNLIEMKDFDFSILRLLDDSIDISSINPLTEEDKYLIKKFLLHFDENWNKYYYLETRYPEVKPHLDDEGDIIYDGQTFTFLNKFFSSASAYIEEYYHICDSIQNVWKDLNETIIWQILPRYIKNNKETNINLEKILKLSKYTTESKKYDISENSKTNNLKRKLAKTNK